MNPAVERIVAALIFAVMSFTAGAASLADKLKPGMPHYYDNFDPGRQPFDPGQELNFEEVFKNYQYYEIVIDQDGKGITVNQYIRGLKSGSEKYLELPDGSLRKK